jgi:hypothetical protein
VIVPVQVALVAPQEHMGAGQELEVVNWLQGVGVPLHGVEVVADQ